MSGTALLKPRAIEVEAMGPNSAIVTMEPFERGYGHTLGNALRRILLSSMVSYAHTEAQITGVVHEYSTVDGVREDVVDILLNMKGIVFKLHTWHYLTAKNPTGSSYQPVPLYLNNIWQAPPFSRVFAFSSTFWHTMNQERPEKLITFSSHSISFKALVDVGFKQTNVVSDDSRIFWQCFLRYDGDYRTVPTYISSVYGCQFGH